MCCVGLILTRGLVNLPGARSTKMTGTLAGVHETPSVPGGRPHCAFQTPNPGKHCVSQSGSLVTDHISSVEAALHACTRWPHATTVHLTPLKAWVVPCGTFDLLRKSRSVGLRVGHRLRRQWCESCYQTPKLPGLAGKGDRDILFQTGKKRSSSALSELSFMC